MASAAFTYCFNTSTIRPARLLDKIYIAGAVGYQAIELWHDDIDQFLAGGGRLADITRALRDAGLVVPTTISLKGWFDSGGADHAVAVAECRRRMEQAAAVAAARVIAGPPRGPADPAQGARHYAELLEIGRPLGVLPAMEFLGFAEGIHTITAAWDIVERVGDPAGTVVLDPFHIFRGGGSMAEIDMLPAERIAVVHFNDAPAHPPRHQQKDSDRVFPGDGLIDLRDMIRRLRRLGYGGCISLELFNESYWARDPREVARVGLEKMRAIVESAT
jgi:sugar phosphate isomerase/epimerase